MSDFATVIIDNGTALAFDWAMAPPDLQFDAGLKTAVIISLFTDARAADDQVVPDDSGDRRGWWGDAPLDNAGDVNAPQSMGSRLWLLERGIATEETATLARSYVEESLRWLITDGIAQSVIVATKWLDRGALSIKIAISRLRAGASIPDARFDFLWNATLSN